MLRDVVCDACSACRDLDLARDPHLQVCLRPLARPWQSFRLALRIAVSCRFDCACDLCGMTLQPCTLPQSQPPCWSHAGTRLQCETRVSHSLAGSSCWTLGVCASPSAASPSRCPVVHWFHVVTAGAAVGVQHVRHGAGRCGGGGAAHRGGGRPEPRLPAAGPEVPQVPPGGLR